MNGLVKLFVNGLVELFVSGLVELYVNGLVKLFFNGLVELFPNGLVESDAWHSVGVFFLARPSCSPYSIPWGFHEEAIY